MVAGFSEVPAGMAESCDEPHGGLVDVRIEWHRKLRQQPWVILGVLVVALEIGDVVVRLG